jgi:hypothetical protein
LDGIQYLAIGGSMTDPDSSALDRQIVTNSWTYSRRTMDDQALLRAYRDQRDLTLSTSQGTPQAINDALRRLEYV